jgi:hypothetical protein
MTHQEKDKSDLFLLIENMWKEDSKLDIDNLHHESIKIPQLHGKYYEIQTKIYKLKKKVKNELDELLLKRFLFYTGKADPEDYARENFGTKVLKSDVEIYLNADKYLAAQRAKLEDLEYLLDYLKDILKQIHNRSFYVGNAIEYMKFIAGQ